MRTVLKNIHTQFNYNLIDYNNRKVFNDNAIAEVEKKSKIYNLALNVFYDITPGLDQLLITIKFQIENRLIFTAQDKIIINYDKNRNICSRYGWDTNTNDDMYVVDMDENTWYNKQFSVDFYNSITTQIKNAGEDTIGKIAKSFEINNFINMFLNKIDFERQKSKYRELYRNYIKVMPDKKCERYYEIKNLIKQCKSIRKVKNIINKYLREISFCPEANVNDNKISFTFLNYLIVVNPSKMVLNLDSNYVKQYTIIFFDTINGVEEDNYHNYYYICIKCDNGVTGFVKRTSLLYIDKLVTKLKVLKCGNNKTVDENGEEVHYTRFTYNNNVGIIVAFKLTAHPNNKYYPKLINSMNIVVFPDGRYIQIEDKQIYQILSALIENNNDIDNMRDICKTIVLLHKAFDTFTEEQKSMLNKYAGQRAVDTISTPLFINDKAEVKNNKITYSKSARIINLSILKNIKYSEIEGINRSSYYYGDVSEKLYLKEVHKTKLTREEKQFVKQIINNIYDDLMPFEEYDKDEFSCIKTDNAYCLNNISKDRNYDETIIFIDANEFGKIRIRRGSSDFSGLYEKIHKTHKLKMNALKELTKV